MLCISRAMYNHIVSCIPVYISMTQPAVLYSYNSTEHRFTSYVYCFMNTVHNTCIFFFFLNLKLVVYVLKPVCVDLFTCSSTLYAESAIK